MLVVCRSEINQLPYAETTKVAEMLRDRARSLIHNLHENISSIWDKLVSIDSDARTVTIQQELKGRDTLLDLEND